MSDEERLVIGTIPRYTAVFRVDGDLTDPTTVALQIEDPSGTVVGYTYSGGPEIVRDSIGSYRADIPAPMLGKWVGRWIGTGTAAGANEDTFIITSHSEESTDVLEAPVDYDGIRALLGASGEWDFPNDIIAGVQFAPGVELWLHDRLGQDRWDEAIVDPDLRIRLRLAAVYFTGCWIAQTMAHGGTLGNVRPTEEPRDWDKLAETLCASGEMWFSRVLETDSSADTLYDIKLMHISGPTRARFVAHGLHPRSWWRYPPVIGVPPDWPWAPQDWLG